jgi:hypothetical protein
MGGYAGSAGDNVTFVWAPPSSNGTSLSNGTVTDGDPAQIAAAEPPAPLWEVFPPVSAPSFGPAPADGTR